MIVKNEEKVLERCLNSVVDIVDEIVIVDTGSTDKTKEIARKFKAKVYDFAWCDDFSKARNYSFSKATKEYVMWMDADDVFKAEDKPAFLAYKKDKLKNFDVVIMRYELGLDADGKCNFWNYRERIIKNLKVDLWCGAIHEVIAPFGNIDHLELSMQHRKIEVHDPLRNLNIYKKLDKQNKVVCARDCYYYARELYYHEEWKKAIKWFNKAVDHQDGIYIEDKINSYLLLSECYAKVNRAEKEKSSLYMAFESDKPRAITCCKIGEYFLSKNNFQVASFWFKNAMTCDRQKSGFVNESYYGYYPAMNLVLCLDKLGNKREAYSYHKIAKALQPDSINVQHNENYFNSLGFKN